MEEAAEVEEDVAEEEVVEAEEVAEVAEEEAVEVDNQQQPQRPPHIPPM